MLLKSVAKVTFSADWQLSQIHYPAPNFFHLVSRTQQHSSSSFPSPLARKQQPSYLQDSQKLIRKWDSECELFYDDIAHVLQNTKKREHTSFNKLDDS